MINIKHSKKLKNLYKWYLHYFPFLVFLYIVDYILYQAFLNLPYINLQFNLLYYSLIIVNWVIILVVFNISRQKVLYVFFAFVLLMFLATILKLSGWSMRLGILSVYVVITYLIMEFISLKSDNKK